MDFSIGMPDDDPSRGFVFDWEDDFEIEVRIIGNSTVQITANRDGLISLARHLINLSQDRYQKGYDFHLDSYNSLSEGSSELIIQKG